MQLRIVDLERSLNKAIGIRDKVEKDRDTDATARDKVIVWANSLETALKEEQKKSVRTKEKYQQSLKAIEKEHQCSLKATGEKENIDNLNSYQFQGDLVKIARPSYFMGFIDAVELASRHLAEEDA